LGLTAGLGPGSHHRGSPQVDELNAETQNANIKCTSSARYIDPLLLPLYGWSSRQPANLIWTATSDVWESTQDVRNPAGTYIGKERIEQALSHATRSWRSVIKGDRCVSDAGASTPARPRMFIRKALAPRSSVTRIRRLDRIPP
jgi:hypothetical protein